MSLSEFHFLRPFWLIAFIPYLAALVFLIKSKLSRGNWSEVCDDALLPYILQEKALHRSRWQLTSGAVAALLVIIALAGPTWERLPSPVFRNDTALVIALDLSRSMDAEDIKPSRLIRARYKIADILKQRKDGQTALLVYAGDAFTVTPLTDDIKTIENQLEALNSDIMPSQGSNTVDALNRAVDLFKQAGLQKGQIFLITDGVDFDKTLPAVKALNGYTLSILGVGTVEGAPIAAPEGGFIKDEQGNIVVAKLNQNELIKLAQAGNGVYRTITTDDSDIQALLTTLNHPAQQQDKENRNVLLDQWSDKGPWLLLPALPLAALMFRKGLLCLMFFLLAPFPRTSHAFDWQDLWKTKDQQAQQAYRQGQYDKAAKLFENPDWKAVAQYKANDYPKALETLANSRASNHNYNQGNALAQSGRLEEAVKAYEKALAENPGDEDAQYNKDIVEKELKKQQQQNNQQKKQDQQDQQPSSQDKSGKEKEKQGENEKPEQSEERKKSASESAQQDSQPKESSEQQSQAQKPENKKPEETAGENQQAKPEEQNKNLEQSAKQTSPVSGQETPPDETTQANEQWLNRIPDDPSGLLKRKFKYQYGQRQHPSNNDVGGW